MASVGAVPDRDEALHAVDEPASLGSVDDLFCPACDHAWDLHPGVNLHVAVCGECIYEEDYDLRAYEAMCTLESPAAAAPLPPGRLRARIGRPLLRGYRVYIEDWQGMRSAAVTPSQNTRDSAERTTASVEADIAAMPVKALRREKYRTPAR